MTVSDKKDQFATWNGDPTSWLEYVKRVRLQYEKTEPRKRNLLGAELASRLTGRAWDVASAELDHHALQQKDGAAYLLRFLEERLCKAPVPDTGQRLEDFFIRLRRQPGSSMTEWATQVREAYRRLQRAMTRQREDLERRGVAPKAAAAKSQASSPTRSNRTTPHPSRAPSAGNPGTPHAASANPITFSERPDDHTGNPGEEDDEPDTHDYERVPTQDPDSDHGWHGNRWTQAEWDEWRRQRRDWDSSTWTDIAEPEDEPIRWEQFDYGHVEILPQEILGWILLRRSGLPASARLSVLSAINNQLDLDSMERAMRDQEEELLSAEAQRHHGNLPRPRRSFWVEEDRQWGLLAEAHMDDEVDGSDTLWLGSQLPPDVYEAEDPSDSWCTMLADGQELHWEWHDDDFYAADAQGVFWSWSETKPWLDLQEAPESDEQRTLHESYATFNERYRTFKESRALNSAKHLSRGFYPVNTLKGKFKGKGKGKSKKPSQTSSMSSSSASMALMTGKGNSSGQRPGNPDYKGCFICGSKDHSFYHCPKRNKQGSSSHQTSKGSFFVRSIFMVTAVEESENGLEPEPTLEQILATVAVEHPGHAVIDTGATETIASLDALQEIMTLRGQQHGPEDVVVHQQQKSFKFGNGSVQKAVSFVEIPQIIAGASVKLGVHALDAPGVPLLISVKTLATLKALIDVDEGMICFREVSEDFWIPLKRGRNGHLLLDLTQDWFPRPDSSSPKAAAIMNSDETVQTASRYKSAAALENFRDHVCEVDEECSHEVPHVHVHDADSSPTCSPLPSQHVADELMSLNCCNELHENQCQEPPPDVAVQGSSMRSALPVLVAATVLSSTSSTSSPLIHDRTGSGQWISQYGVREEGTKGKAEVNHSKAERADTGTIRLQQTGGARPKGPSGAGFSLPWLSCGDERRARIPLGQERPRPLESLQSLPPEDTVCASIWSKRDLPPGGTPSTRLRDSPQTGGNQDRERCSNPREVECQSSQPAGCRGISEEQAEAAGEGEGQDVGQACDSTRSCFGINSHRDDEEGIQERICGDTGEGRGQRVGAGEDSISTLEDHQPEGTFHVLTSDLKERLRQAGEDYILEANEAFEEIYGGNPSEVDLLEVCCPPDSRLTQVFLDRGRQAMRIGLPAFDLSTSRGIEELLYMINTYKPKVAWFSLPCGPYSPIQALFNEDTPEKLARSLMRKKKARKLIRNALRAVSAQLEQGGEIGWEWPNINGGWQLPELRALRDLLQQRQKLHTVRVDGCAYGLKNSRGVPLKKPWRILTSSQTMASLLECRCPGDHDHEECLGGKEARDSGFYPKKMCDVIFKATMSIVNNTTNGPFPQVYPVFEDTLAEDPKMDKHLAPLTEKEKSAASKTLMKLHRRTGHPSNSALAGCLRHRGAHPEIIEMAKKHQCPECQELRLAELNPSSSLQQSEVLWETMVMDGAEFPIDDMVYNCLIMVDEASRLVCPHLLFSHKAVESRNSTGPEIVEAVQDSWVRHYGMPAAIRMDPEGSFRSTEFANWASERGIEVLPCAAEAHQQIGVVERMVRTIKSTVKQLLQSGEFEPWQAILHACQAHNEMERVEGYSPYQWAFGRQPTLTGRFHDRGYDDPFWTSSMVAGSNMAANLKLRVKAQTTFLKLQSQEHVTRAMNSKTRRQQVFLPGDMVYFKRIKPPAQPMAAARMPHKLWRWYGPGRVLATETRSDAMSRERKPAHIVWIVTHGRLKRCSPEQLRHASEREKVLAESAEAPTATWTFHSLTQTLFKGEFEILDDNLFPEDVDAKGPPRTTRRARSEGPERARSRTPQPQRAKPSDPFAEDPTLAEIMKDAQKPKKTTKIPSTPKARSSAAPSAPAPDESSFDPNRFLRDPSYRPVPDAVQEGRTIPELFQQPLFKKQRRDLGGDAQADAFHAEEVGSFNGMCMIELDLPKTASEWKRLRRSPEAFFVKKGERSRGAMAQTHS